MQCEGVGTLTPQARTLTPAPHVGNILDAFRIPADPAPSVQRVSDSGEAVDYSQHRDPELMLISAHAIVAGNTHREQQRLRALARSGATTAPKILPLLSRLKRLAIHGA